jgi:hypothetical protein
MWIYDMNRDTMINLNKASTVYAEGETVIIETGDAYFQRIGTPNARTAISVVEQIADILNEDGKCIKIGPQDGLEETTGHSGPIGFLVTTSDPDDDDDDDDDEDDDDDDDIWV